MRDADPPLDCDEGARNVERRAERGEYGGSEHLIGPRSRRKHRELVCPDAGHHVVLEAQQKTTAELSNDPVADAASEALVHFAKADDVDHSDVSAEARGQRAL